MVSAPYDTLIQWADQQAAVAKRSIDTKHKTGYYWDSQS
jgi:hypothetical protein